MMWADRVGIGVAALVVIGACVAYGLDTTGDLQRERSDKYKAAIAWCVEYQSSPKPEPKTEYEHMVEDLAEKYLKPTCPPKEPEVIADPRIVEGAMRIMALVVLPLWLALRVFDFMIGGPARRRASKHSVNYNGPRFS